MAQFVYLETAPGSGVFNLRGEVGPGDNPDGFARQMLRGGLRTAFRSEVVTDENGNTINKGVTAEQLEV